MAGSMYLMAPNRLGDSFTNSGLDSFVANHGYGVAEATKAQQVMKKNSEPKDKLRTAKAREFGKTKQTVGF